MSIAVDIRMTAEPDGVTVSLWIDGREVAVITLDAIEARDYGQALIDYGVAVQTMARGDKP